jgi:LPXTG-site transpeptidase (sortase) family protein
MAQESKSKRGWLSWLPWVLIGAAIVAAIAGGVLAWHQHNTNLAADRAATQQMERANHGHATGDTPSTIKPHPSAFDSYTVPADQPRYIFIPKIDVRAMVKPTWLTTAGAVGSPTNIYDTAWYVHSAKPGQPGATLIDGHVGFWTKHGVFFNLKDLQVGDKIQVVRGDGKTLHYTVVKTKVYPYDQVDMRVVLSPVSAGKSGLNLITCTGDVVKGSNTYNQRIVIFAGQDV